MLLLLYAASLLSYLVMNKLDTLKISQFSEILWVFLNFALEDHWKITLLIHINGKKYKKILTLTGCTIIYTWYMVRIVLQICVMVLGQHAGRAVFLTRKIKCEQSLGYGDIKAVFEFFGYKSCILFTVLSVNHSRLVGYLVLDYDQFRQFLKLGLVMWLILTNHSHVIDFNQSPLYIHYCLQKNDHRPASTSVMNCSVTPSCCSLYRWVWAK